MAPGYIHELRIAPGGPDRHHVAECEEGEACDPELKPESNGSCQCGIGNRQSARCTAEQDVLGERPMDRYGKAAG